MNCDTCHEVIDKDTSVMVWPADGGPKHFCSKGCVRAWCGPAQPLTQRLKELENAVRLVR